MIDKRGRLFCIFSFLLAALVLTPTINAKTFILVNDYSGVASNPSVAYDNYGGMFAVVYQEFFNIVFDRHDTRLVLDLFDSTGVKYTTVKWNVAHDTEPKVVSKNGRAIVYYVENGIVVFKVFSSFGGYLIGTHTAGTTAANPFGIHDKESFIFAWSENGGVPGAGRILSSTRLTTDGQTQYGQNIKFAYSPSSQDSDYPHMFFDLGTLTTITSFRRLSLDTGFKDVLTFSFIPPGFSTITGIFKVNDAGNSHDRIVSSLLTYAGKGVVVWDDRRQGGNSIFGQVISRSGNQFVKQGFNVDLGTGLGYKLGDIGSDDNNNFLLLKEPGNSVIGMKLNSSLQSDFETIITSDGNHSRVSFAGGLVNKYMVVWQDAYRIWATMINQNFTYFDTPGILPVAPPSNLYTEPADAETKGLSIIGSVNGTLVSGNTYSTDQSITISDASFELLKIFARFSTSNVSLTPLVVRKDASRTFVKDLSAAMGVGDTFEIRISNINNGSGVFICTNITDFSQLELANCGGRMKTEVRSFPTTVILNEATLTINLNSTTNIYTVFSDKRVNLGAGNILLPSTLEIEAASISEDNKTFEFRGAYRYNVSANQTAFVPSAACTISFDKEPTGPFAMAFNSTTEKYIYAKTFNMAQTVAYTISCSSVGYAPQAKQAILSIVAVSPVNVVLSSPADNAVINTDTVTFTCTATDPSNITAIDLFADTSGQWKLRNTKTGLSAQTETATFTLSNVADGKYNWNCRAANSKGENSFASLNLTFTVAKVDVQSCLSSDWFCGEWSPSDASCQPGTQQAITCNLQNLNCKDPDVVKPATTKDCPNRLCTTDDYTCSDWLECTSAGNQTRTCRLNSNVTCFGDSLKTENRSCTPPSSPLLLIVIILIIIGTVTGVLFFYFHRKGKEAGEEEETLWEEEYGKEEGEERSS